MRIFNSLALWAQLCSQENHLIETNNKMANSDTGGFWARTKHFFISIFPIHLYEEKESGHGCDAISLWKCYCNYSAMYPIDLYFGTFHLRGWHQLSISDSLTGRWLLLPDTRKGRIAPKSTFFPCKLACVIIVFAIVCNLYLGWGECHCQIYVRVTIILLSLYQNSGSRKCYW